MAKNIVFKELTNKAVQDSILDILKYRNPFLRHFEKEVNIWNTLPGVWGDKATFLGSQPNEGVDYRYDIKQDEFKPSETLSQDIDLKIKKIYYDVTSEDIGKLAMDNPKKLAELIALKVKYISRKADFDLSRAVVDEICKLDHYSKNSLIKHPKAIYDSLEGLFAEILEAGTNLTYPKTKFNKQGKLAAALSPKDLVLIVSPDLYNKIVEKIYTKTYNLSLVDLKQMFKYVIVQPLEAPFKMLLLDSDNIAIRYAIKKTGSEYVERNMCTYIYSHHWAFVGQIGFSNAVAWVVEEHGKEIKKA